MTGLIQYLDDDTVAYIERIVESVLSRSGMSYDILMNLFYNIKKQIIAWMKIIGKVV